eukprot:12910670-Alexandrium_andersonii.AAC.1
MQGVPEAPSVATAPPILVISHGPSSPRVGIAHLESPRGETETVQEGRFPAQDVPQHLPGHLHGPATLAGLAPSLFEAVGQELDHVGQGQDDLKLERRGADPRRPRGRARPPGLRT